MNSRIKEFIENQKCATICCIDENGAPYCFNVFYAFDSNKHLLYYKSAGDTRHSGLLKQKPAVAGSILPGEANILPVRGIQFEGSLIDSGDSVDNSAENSYYTKYPLARLRSGHICMIQLSHIKFTDNRLGFGTKMHWCRNEAQTNL